MWPDRCVACRQSKIKCSGDEPCANCKRRLMNCRFEEPGHKVLVEERCVSNKMLFLSIIVLMEIRAAIYRSSSKRPKYNSRMCLQPSVRQVACLERTLRLTVSLWNNSIMFLFVLAYIRLAEAVCLGSDSVPQPPPIDHTRSIWISPFTLPSTIVKGRNEGRRNWSKSMAIPDMFPCN